MSPSDLTGVTFRAAKEPDLPILIEIGRKAFLFAFWELSPIEVIRDWVTSDFEGRQYPEPAWPCQVVAGNFGVQRRRAGILPSDRLSRSRRTN